MGLFKDSNTAVGYSGVEWVRFAFGAQGQVERKSYSDPIILLDTVGDQENNVLTKLKHSKNKKKKYLMQQPVTTAIYYEEDDCTWRYGVKDWLPTAKPVHHRL